jgi:large subunit ribosomal protein L21
MYAVFRTGGKQYRAEQGDVLRVERLDAEEGASIEFGEVLLVGDGKDLTIGSPLVEGTSVSARVVRQGKSGKVPVVKFRRRQNYLRQGTHRQFFTEIEITAIGGEAAGAQGGDTAEAKPAAPAKKKAGKKAASKKKAAGKKSAKKSPGKKTTRKADSKASS